MANDKKGEKKTAEAPANGNGAAPEKAADAAPTSTAATAIVVAKPATGLPVPTIQDLDALAATARDKFEAFALLLNDESLSAPVKEKLKGLIDQANPVKPGMEEVVTTWSVPRITLVQPTTNDPKKPESARPGDLYSSAGQLLERPFGFIPFYFHTENIKFKQGEKAPECSAPDAKLGSPYGLCQSCPHLPLGQQNGGRGQQKKTECQNQIVVAALSADLSQVYLMQFAKTSRSAGSALMALAKAQPFPWKQSYLLSSSKETGDLGTYYILKTEPTGKDNSAEAQRVAKALNEMYTANRKKFLGEYYFNASAGSQTAAAAEADFDAKLDAGLDPGRRGGEEPDLASPPPAPTPSVKSSAKPM